MLQAKKYHNFKGHKNCLLIIGDYASFRNAGAYFNACESGPFLSDQYISIEGAPSSNRQLSLSREENAIFAEICENLAVAKNPSHDYLAIADLPDTDIIVSCDEYDHFPK